MTSTVITDNLLEIIAIGISVITLAVTLFYREKQRRTLNEIKNEFQKVSSKSEKALKTSEGNLEISMRDSISVSRNHLARASKDYKDFKMNHPRKKDDFYQKLFFEALEDYINKYERACMLFLDEKIDPERFKREYRTEIRRLVEEGDYKERYFPAHSSKFKAILKVYEEWENQEK